MFPFEKYLSQKVNGGMMVKIIWRKGFRNAQYFVTLMDPPYGMPCIGNRFSRYVDSV